MTESKNIAEELDEILRTHPMRSFMNALSNVWRGERSMTQMTLGKLLFRLDELDDVVITPPINHPHSYRGYYTDLALEPTNEESITVNSLKEILRGCIDKTFEGYKGGDFVMTLDTPMWVAHYSMSGQRIMGVSDAGELQFAEDPAFE